MVCLRNICINTLHKGDINDNDDDGDNDAAAAAADDDDDNNNNNNNTVIELSLGGSRPYAILVS